MQTYTDLRAPVVTWATPGLVAGAAFLGFEVAAGAFTTSPWAFPQSIVQTVGLGAPTGAFDLIQTALGSGIHLAFSVGLGLVFIALSRRLGLAGWRIFVAGALFTWAESAISIWLVLHSLFPATLPLLFAAVPFWASFVGRTGFGLVLAYVSRGRPC